MAQQAEKKSLPKYARKDEDEIAQVDANAKEEKDDNKSSSQYGKPADSIQNMLIIIIKLF